MADEAAVPLNKHQRRTGNSPLRVARSLWGARELLRNLVVRDLKVRYKKSVLGIAWSMITPLAMMFIFTFIFTQVFKTSVKDFQVFFLAGFLPWLYFSNSLMTSVSAIVGNGPLIKKVFFPREVLPIATVLSQGVHFLLSLVVFGAYMLFIGYNFLPLLPLVLMAFILQTLLNMGFAMGIAAGNVSFRDIQELIGIIILLWFYGTPIIYELGSVPAKYRPILKVNPMTWFVDMYRQLLYYRTLPSLETWTICIVSAVLAFGLGYALFNRLAVSFAKEI